jgi:hypothetical protein
MSKYRLLGNTMKLQIGATYTNNTSDLAIKVLSIYYEDDTIVKIKGKIFNKRNGFVYERKRFDLSKELIKSWELFKR